MKDRRLTVVHWRDLPPPHPDLAITGIPDSNPADEMNSRSILSAALLVAISCSLSSCFSSSKVNSKNEASVGQQLMDLDRSRQQGIITEKEYAKLKKAIIKNND